MKLQRLFQLFIISTLLINLIGASGHVLARSTEPSISVTINPANISIGGKATISVSLNNVPVAGYSGAEFACTYHMNLVEAGNINVTHLFGESPITVVNGPQNGRFILAIAGNQGNKAVAGGIVFTFSVSGLQAGLVVIDCNARVSEGNNSLSQLSSAWTSFHVLGSVTTPAPATSTVLPTSCYKAELIADITIPSGTVVFPGKPFLKTWRFKNTGTCAWNNFLIGYYSGELMTTFMSAPVSVSPEPGQFVDISITMTAPSEAGSHHTYWMFRNSKGELFGIGPQGNQPFLVDIQVSNSTPTHVPPTISVTPTIAQSTQTLTASITPSGPTATPMPGVTYDFFANACAATWYNAAGQLPCPGTDGDPNGFVLPQNSLWLENNQISTHPVLLAFPQNINNGYIKGTYPAYKVKTGDWFRATIGCEFGATNCYVVFRLDYAILGSNNIQTLWAFVKKHEGQLYDANIDLTPLVGQDVKFTLTILSTGPATDDRAIWVNPTIYHADPSATTPIIGQVFAGKPVTISLYREDNSLFTSVNVDSEGKFSLAAPLGTYTMVASASGYLRARGPVWLTLGSGPRISSTISLFAGDINGNDVIDHFDALTIGMNYSNSVPSEADLNDDGIINVLDLEMLALHYHYGGFYWQ